MQLDGTQIEEGGNNMRFRKCGSVLLVLVLVMSMMIGGGLTVFAEVGPGVQGVSNSDEGGSGDVAQFDQTELPVLVMPGEVAENIYFPPYDFIFPNNFQEQYHMDALPIGVTIREVDKNATVAEILKMCQMGDANEIPQLQRGSTYSWCAKVTVPTVLNPNDPSWVIRIDTYFSGRHNLTSTRADFCLGGPGNIMYDVQGLCDAKAIDSEIRNAYVDIEQCYVGYVNTLDMQLEEVGSAIATERVNLSNYVKISAEIIKNIPDPGSMLYRDEHILLHMNATIRGEGLKPGQSFYVVFKYKLD